MATGSETRPILTDAEKEELSGYEFPFENIVFEAGGAKGIAYVGALRVLEELGVMHKIKRYAGASAGSITAGLLCIGYSATELQGRLIEEEVPVHDGSWTKRFYYLLRQYGWYPGKKFDTWYSKLLAEKTGNADITFQQIYKRYNKELCIAVTNVNTMDVCYCHVKTTPDMPVREAVRMSMSIPGVFCAVKHQLYSDKADLFVDGAILCSYPIHCYDGWYLSMKTEDSFLQRFASVSLDEMSKIWDKKSRFGERNEKTLGFLLYSMHDPDVFQLELQQREHHYCGGESRQELPDTKLAKEFKDDRKEIELACQKHKELSEAITEFVKILAENDIDQNGLISMEEFKKAMSSASPAFTEEHRRHLFGENYNIDEVFNRIDADDNQEISFRELIAFAEQQGLHLRDIFCGHKRKPINDLKQHFSAIGRGLLLATKYVFICDEDVHRTAGVDTVYLETTSFEMDGKDKLFLVQQGKLGCMAYLRSYIERKKLTKAAAATTVQEPQQNSAKTNGKSSTPTGLSDVTPEVVGVVPPEVNGEQLEMEEKAEPENNNADTDTDISEDTATDPEASALLKPKD